MDAATYYQQVCVCVCVGRWAGFGRCWPPSAIPPRELAP